MFGSHLKLFGLDHSVQRHHHFEHAHRGHQALRSHYDEKGRKKRLTERSSISTESDEEEEEERKRKKKKGKRKRKRRRMDKEEDEEEEDYDHLPDLDDSVNRLSKRRKIAKIETMPNANSFFSNQDDTRQCMGIFMNIEDLELVQKLSVPVIITKEIAQYATGQTLPCFNLKCDDFACLLEEEVEDGRHRSADNPFYRWALEGPSWNREYERLFYEDPNKYWCSSCTLRAVRCDCGMWGFHSKNRICGPCKKTVCRKYMESIYLDGDTSEYPFCTQCFRTQHKVYPKVYRQISEHEETEIKQSDFMCFHWDQFF